MADRKDPAFPLNVKAHDGSHSYTAPGVSMLEWYAGKALTGILADHRVDLSAGRLATTCFDIAEAMVAEAQKRNAGA